jgi:MFS family permease
MMDWASLRHVIFERDGLALTWAALGGALALLATVLGGMVADWWQHRHRREGPSRWRAMWANLKPPYRPHRPGRFGAYLAIVLWAWAFYSLLRDYTLALALALAATVATVVYLARRVRWARWLEQREAEVDAAVAARQADTDRLQWKPDLGRIITVPGDLRQPVGPVTVICPRTFPNLKGVPNV